MKIKSIKVELPYYGNLNLEYFTIMINDSDSALGTIDKLYNAKSYKELIGVIKTWKNLDSDDPIYLENLNEKKGEIKIRLKNKDNRDYFFCVNYEGKL